MSALAALLRLELHPYLEVLQRSLSAPSAMHSQHSFYTLPELPGLQLRHGDGSRIAYGIHAHDTYSLGLVLSGRTRYQCENRHHDARGGDAMVFPPHTPHACNPQQAPWRYLMLYVTAEGWQQAGLPPFGPWWQWDGCPLRCRRMVAALVALLRAMRTNDAPAACLAWQRAAAALHPMLTGPQPSRLPAWRDQLPAWMVHTTVASPAVGRRWRRVLADSGMSPHQWQRNQRINQAKVLLHQGMALAEVAAVLGFSDQAHFQRWFKQHTAITPGHYRAIIQQQALA